MKRNWMIFVFLWMLLTGCSALGSSDSQQTSIAQAAAEIADFDPPKGYKPEFKLALDAYTLVSYSPGDGRSHLYLIQSTRGEDKERLPRALQNIVLRNSDRETRMTVTEKRSVTVRGQEAVLLLCEGTNGDGRLYRQAMVAFDGDGGPALLVLSTPADAWDTGLVEDLIASIRQEKP